MRGYDYIKKQAEAKNDYQHVYSELLKMYETILEKYKPLAKENMKNWENFIKEHEEAIINYLKYEDFEPESTDYNSIQKFNDRMELINTIRYYDSINKYNT